MDSFSTPSPSVEERVSFRRLEGEGGGGEGAVVKGAVSMNLADDFYPIIFRAIPR